MFFWFDYLILSPPGGRQKAAGLSRNRRHFFAPEIENLQKVQIYTLRKTINLPSMPDSQYWADNCRGNDLVIFLYLF